MRLEDSLKHEAIISEEIAKGYDVLKLHVPFSSISSRFTLIDISGKVLYDSDEHKKENILDNHLSRQEIRDAIRTGEGFSIRKSSTQNVEKAYYARKFFDVNNREFFLRVSRNYNDVSDELNYFLLLNIGFFILLNLMMYILYRNYLKRDFINKIEKIKKYLENKNGGSPREYHVKEEVWFSQLWSIIESWQSKNLKNLEELKSEKVLLNTVISSVDLSIVLFDENFNTILKNDSLNYLFDSRGKNLFTSVKKLELLNLIKEFKVEKDNYYEKNRNSLEHFILNKEIFISDIKRYYTVNLIYIVERSYYLVLIKDITPIKEFGEIQKKFISNVGHELKTPLSNIKGYTIALEDAPTELREGFFKTIYNNIAKTENIINDFLNISKIESEKIINLDIIEISQIEAELKIALSNILKEKSGVLNFNYDNLPMKKLKTDYDKILLCLKNIVENGFIYNSSPIPTVNLTFSQDEKNYYILVKDNGIGIEESKLDKIFQRFYRVDKARTSNLAGTGLGLAIVKEVIEALNGSIIVKSKLDRGTEFKITLSR